MVRVELGKGSGGLDTINIFDIDNCIDSCSHRQEGGRFHCTHHNSHAVVIVTGGVTRYTLDEFIKAAPCCKKINS